jgi:hypothetical protein
MNSDRVFMAVSPFVKVADVKWSVCLVSGAFNNLPKSISDHAPDCHGIVKGTTGKASTPGTGKSKGARSIVFQPVWAGPPDHEGKLCDVTNSRTKW